MSIFGMMGTAITGLNAQANKLGTISDNISNSNTTGYKDATEAFETVLGDQTPGTYSSGGVTSVTSYGITSQGSLNASTTTTNLGIDGNGFFVVNSASDGSGTTALTRAGDFVPDAKGNLVNTAGYYLMGYDQTSSNPSALTVVNAQSGTLQYSASTTATFSANLPSTDSLNTTHQSSITVYDSLGTATNLNVQSTQSGADSWTVNVTNSSGDSVGQTTLTFDPTTGGVTSGSPAALTVPNSDGSGQTTTVSLDLSGMTQLGSSYSVTKSSTDGYAPSKLSSVSVATDGTLSYNYANGTQQVKYKIPLATVASPDNLTSESGNVYLANNASGTTQIGTANTNGLGTINSGELEASTVDIATELSNMIQAQQAYQANSKVLQTASDLLSVINNLK